MALGLLGEKLKADPHHLQRDDEHVVPRHLKSLWTCASISREDPGAWQVTGDGTGLPIYCNLIQPANSRVEENIQDYLRNKMILALTETFARLQDIYLAHPKGK